MRRATISMLAEAKGHLASAMRERARLIFIHGCAIAAVTVAWAMLARALVADSSRLSAVWAGAASIPLWVSTGNAFMFLDWCWPSADGAVRHMLVWGFAVGAVVLIATIAALSAAFADTDGGLDDDKLGIGLSAAIAIGVMPYLCFGYAAVSGMWCFGGRTHQLADEHPQHGGAENGGGAENDQGANITTTMAWQWNWCRWCLVWTQLGITNAIGGAVAIAYLVVLLVASPGFRVVATVVAYPCICIGLSTIFINGLVEQLDNIRWEGMLQGKRSNVVFANLVFAVKGFLTLPCAVGLFLAITWPAFLIGAAVASLAEAATYIVVLTRRHGRGGRCLARATRRAQRACTSCRGGTTTTAAPETAETPPDDDDAEATSRHGDNATDEGMVQIELQQQEMGATPTDTDTRAGMRIEVDTAAEHLALCDDGGGASAAAAAAAAPAPMPPSQLSPAAPIDPRADNTKKAQWTLRYVQEDVAEVLVHLLAPFLVKTAALVVQAWASRHEPAGRLSGAEEAAPGAALLGQLAALPWGTVAARAAVLGLCEVLVDLCKMWWMHWRYSMRPWLVELKTEITLLFVANSAAGQVTSFCVIVTAFAFTARMSLMENPW